MHTAPKIEMITERMIRGYLKNRHMYIVPVALLWQRKKKTLFNSVRPFINYAYIENVVHSLVNDLPFHHIEGT